MEIGLADRQHDQIVAGGQAALAFDVNSPFVGAQSLQPVRYLGVAHEKPHLSPPLLVDAPAGVERGMAGGFWRSRDGMATSHPARLMRIMPPMVKRSGVSAKKT